MNSTESQERRELSAFDIGCVVIGGIIGVGIFFTPKAVNAGILFMLARVPMADRSAVLSGFVEMGISLAETS